MTQTVHTTDRSLTMSISQETPAMTAQQRAFTDPSRGRLARYKQLAVGDGSWFLLVGYELYQLFASAIPGLLGLFLRSIFLPFLAANSGRGVAIGRGVTIRQPQRIVFGSGVLIDDFVSLDIRHDKQDHSPSIQLGDRVCIGRESIIVSKNATIRINAGCNIGTHCRIASESAITIGESSLIAAYCYIGPGNHRFEDTSRPVIEQGMEESVGVSIGKNVWVGTRSTILDGVTIGDNAVIGAHSLVSENIPANAIAFGTPAKVVRFRP